VNAKDLNAINSTMPSGRFSGRGWYQYRVAVGVFDRGDPDVPVAQKKELVVSIWPGNGIDAGVVTEVDISWCCTSLRLR
jgi:hypothetical protein